MGDSLLESLGSNAMGMDGADLIKDSATAGLCMEIDGTAAPFTESDRENVATAEDWRKALNKVVPAVVVLRTTACRAFDTEAAGASYATGFVVDKARGIILTNRHVVKPGPVVVEWKGDILAMTVTEKDRANDESSKFQNSILNKLYLRDGAGPRGAGHGSAELRPAWRGGSAVTRAGQVPIRPVAIPSYRIYN